MTLVGVVAAVFVVVGATYAAGGFDWLAQQDELDRPPSSSIPGLEGERAIVASSDDWAVLAWRKTDGDLCVDVAYQGQGATGCGFPVPGAAAEAPPAAERQAAAGVGAVEGRGPRVVVAGVAAADVARVDLVLVDGRTVPAAMYPAPAALGTSLRFFVSRFAYDGTLPTPGGAGLVRTYLAYDDAGKLVDAA